jgi:hypothetical protein
MANGGFLTPRTEFTLGVIEGATPLIQGRQVRRAIHESPLPDIS